MKEVGIDFSSGVPKNVSRYTSQSFGTANSTLSHHVEKMWAEGLADVQLEGAFHRYTVINTRVLLFDS